jgi:hypothetical protein
MAPSSVQSVSIIPGMQALGRWQLDLKITQYTASILQSARFHGLHKDNFASSRMTNFSHSKQFNKDISCSSKAIACNIHTYKQKYIFNFFSFLLKKVIVYEWLLKSYTDCYKGVASILIFNISSSTPAWLLGP